ncbi:MAG: nitrate/nitrite transporter NrtS [Candidatus Sericytochromatia bacterium]
MNSVYPFFKVALSAKILINSFKIALVVGTVLNLINQGSALTSGQGISWLYVFLNFCVPFCVATYSAAKNQMDSEH